MKDEFEISVTPPRSIAPAPIAPGVAVATDGDGDLAIEVSGGRATFAPLEAVAGTFQWDLTGPARWIEGRLFWFTRGKGTMDVSIVDHVRFDTPDRQDTRPFRFALPDRPYSFSGKLISVVWAIELIAEPGDRNRRVDIVVAPGGPEVLLREPSTVGGPV